MTDPEIIQRAYELELIALYHTLVESMSGGDRDGALARFENGWAINHHCRAMAVNAILPHSPVTSPSQS